AALVDLYIQPLGLEVQPFHGLLYRRDFLEGDEFLLNLILDFLGLKRWGWRHLHQAGKQCHSREQARQMQGETHGISPKEWLTGGWISRTMKSTVNHGGYDTPNMSKVLWIMRHRRNWLPRPC